MRLFSRTAHETPKQYMDRVEDEIPHWRNLEHQQLSVNMDGTPRPCTDGVYVPDYDAYVSLRK